MKEKTCISMNDLPKTFPAQHQSNQPGMESEMTPLPIFDDPCYKGSGKLKDKVALITGGDSGIGRAVAIAFAKEGAKVVISYLNEQTDAEQTKSCVESYGGTCALMMGDLRSEVFCKQLVEDVVKQFGTLDILVNNAAVQFPQNSLEAITKTQLETTFDVNLFSMFYMTQGALKHMKQGSCIINTTSITAYEGHDKLMDYASTKGAIVAFTRSLSQSIINQGIRVNAVAPGPIWTPLIVSSFSKEEVSQFGKNAPMKRAGQPFELAPTYVYLASNDSSYVSGQVLHVNGGTIVGS